MAWYGDCDWNVTSCMNCSYKVICSSVHLVKWQQAQLVMVSFIIPFFTSPHLSVFLIHITTSHIWRRQALIFHLTAQHQIDDELNILVKICQKVEALIVWTHHHKSAITAIKPTKTLSLQNQLSYEGNDNIPKQLFRNHSFSTKKSGVHPAQ